MTFLFLFFFHRSTFVGYAWSFGFFIPATTANDLCLRRYDAVLDWGLNPGPLALEASTIPLGYRGGGAFNEQYNLAPTFLNMLLPLFSNNKYGLKVSSRNVWNILQTIVFNIVQEPRAFYLKMSLLKTCFLKKSSYTTLRYPRWRRRWPPIFNLK